MTDAITAGTGPAPAARREGAQGWWHRLLGIRRPQEPARGNPAVRLHNFTDDFTFTTPAQGDAFSFLVHVHCDWSAVRRATNGASPNEVAEELLDAVAAARRTMRRRVEDLVRPRARDFPPYRPSEAESAIAPLVRGCLTDGDLECDVTLRVSVTDPVRAALSAYWLERMNLDLQGERAERFADQLRNLQHTWAEVLTDGLGRPAVGTFDSRTWISPHALALAERPENVAQTLQKMVEQREKEALQLRDGVGRSVDGHLRVDAFDFVARNDTALRATMEALGVRLPPLPPDSPLAEPS